MVPYHILARRFQVVITDKYPVALHYVAHLDQVWVLNWRSVYDDGVKTIQVIRDASQKKKHHTVHPEPIDGQFDLVRDLFMPTAQVKNCTTRKQVERTDLLSLFDRFV